MKSYLNTLVLAVTAMFFLTGFSQDKHHSWTDSGTLTIELVNLVAPEGYVQVSLYDCKQAFLKSGKSWATKRVKVTDGGKAVVEFENIPLGEWAAAGYHDRNGNNKLDKNFIGLPKEPYAFSKAFKKKTRKPRFREVRFRFEQPGQVLQMGFQQL